MTAQYDNDEVIEETTDQTKKTPPVRRPLVFTTIALALMMMAVDGTIVATALDALKTGLDTSVNWAGWTITIYAFGFVLMLPISGKLAHHFGNRKVFMGSIIAFTVASLCCGLANSIYTLIALRALQAAGGAGFTPSATGIIVQHFGDARDRAVGLFGSIFPIGGMTGPIFGGVIVSYWDWRGIFLINVPIGLAVALLIFLYFPHDQPKKSRHRSRLDVRGLMLLGLGLLTTMLAATGLGEPDIHVWSPSFWIPLVIGIAALWQFMRHIHRTTDPFIEPNLIHGRHFGVVNMVNILYGGCSGGLMALVPLYAINHYGMNALDAGTLLIAQGLAAILFSSLAAFSLRSTGYRPPIFFGAIFVVAGFLLLSLEPPAGIPPYAWLASATFLFGVGGGALNPASRNAGLQLEPGKAASIAALRSMCMQVGRIATISIATAIIASAGNTGVAQSWIYFVSALTLILAAPLILRIPEHRGSW